MPLTIPDNEPIVATLTALETHTPPGSALLKVIELPAQTVVGPVMGEIANEGREQRNIATIKQNFFIRVMGWCFHKIMKKYLLFFFFFFVFVLYVKLKGGVNVLFLYLFLAFQQFGMVGLQVGEAFFAIGNL